jgi:transcriptional regulator
MSKSYTQEQLKQIEDLYNSGATQAKIARLLNCSQTHISMVMRKIK